MVIRFKQIKTDDALSVFFNKLMRRMQTMRTFCAPISFKRDKDTAALQDEKYCDFLRYEQWMHATVNRLHHWIDTIDLYSGEFDGSWEYYARYHRMKYIRDTGDENEVGDTEDEAGLEQFSVLSDLSGNGMMDIVQNTIPDDLNGMCADIIAISHIDIMAGLKKCFGGSIQSFRQDEDGTLHPMDENDHDLQMAIGKVEAEDDCKRIKGICSGIYGILHIINSCSFDDNNTERMHMIRSSARSLLDMDFNAVKDIIKEFRKNYPEYEEKCG